MPAQTLKDQIATLRATGFVVVPRLFEPARCTALRELAQHALHARIGPLEYEADLQYPGAPASRTAEGGATVRRLLDAYGRGPLVVETATAPEIRDWMETCFGEPVLLSRAHHNCIMTKHPAYGSLTGWHRDARYWSFQRDDLISAWIALGDETVENGALWFVPGSHAISMDASRFDTQKFFRADLPANEALLRTAVLPTLAQGDVVFFHCNTLHAAGRNQSGAVKYSLVTTYHGQSNAPCPGTRTASMPEVLLGHDHAPHP